MTRLFLTLAMLCYTLPAAASDLTAMSDPERQAFGEEVRAYLLENPEVLIEAYEVLQQRQANAQASTDEDLIATNAEALFEDGYSFVGGNPDGDVTVVEFLDYQCGYCKKAFPEVNQLLETDGNIRLIVKEFPILGEASVLASRFAIAVKAVEGDEAYGMVHDALMEFRGQFTAESLRALALAKDLDAEAIMAEMDSDAVTEVIAQNHSLAQRLQINGTPGFVIGRQMVRGYAPLDDMTRVVAEARGE